MLMHASSLFRVGKTSLKQQKLRNPIYYRVQKATAKVLWAAHRKTLWACKYPLGQGRTLQPSLDCEETLESTGLKEPKDGFSIALCECETEGAGRQSLRFSLETHMSSPKQGTVNFGKHRMALLTYNQFFKNVFLHR